MPRLWMIVLMLLWLVACSEHAVQESLDSGVQGRGSDTAAWWDALPRKAWSDYERVLPAEPWFQVYRVLPDVYAIYEPGQFEEVISFLVLGNERALLFDTGLGIASMKPVIDQLTSLDVLVVNSHSHYDHVGGNYEFETIKGLDHAFARRNAKGRSNAEVGQYVTGDWMAKPIPSGIDVSNYAIQPYTVNSHLTDGTILDLGGRQLQVILTPGHTPDSLCLIDREHRLLFTGDTFYLAPLYAHVENANYVNYKDSADRLAELMPYVDYLLTAHNVPLASSDYLRKLKNAFDAIDTGDLRYISTDGAFEYRFDGFSIIAPSPSPGVPSD